MLQGLAFLSLARLATLMWRYQNDAGPLPPRVPAFSLPLGPADAPDGTGLPRAATDTVPGPEPPASSSGSRRAANAVDEAAVKTADSSGEAVSNIVPQKHGAQRRAVQSTVQERE